MANRYWVGGTAAWDGTAGTKWALTSGGAGGQAVPTSADDVFFSAASTGTCTISAGNTGAKSINCTGFTGTLAGTAAITVSGSVTLDAGMTMSYTGTLTLNATGTLTSAGKTLGSITISGASITVTLGDACTTGVTNTVTLTQGTLALAGFTLSTGIFSSSNTNTRAISFGAGNINLTSATAGTTILSAAVGSNLSWTGTGGFVRNQVATATMSWGSTNFTNGPNLTVNAGSAALTLTAASYFKTTNFTGSTCDVASSSTGSINFQGNITLASGGTYTSLPIFNSSSNTITSNGRSIRSLTVSTSGTTVTLADALTTVVSVSHTQATFNLAGFTVTTPVWLGSGTLTRVLAFGSGGNIVLNSSTPAATILSIATATGFTWTGTGQFTRNMVATATVVFGTTGGTTSNAPNLTVNNGASDLTVTSGSYLKNVDFTGSTSIVTATYNACGNLTLASGGTYTSVAPTFLASGTVTSSGKTLGATTVNGSGITVTLADAMTLGAASTFTLTQGTLALAGFTLSTGIFSSNGSSVRSIAFGSGNIELTSTTASTTVLSMGNATNFTWTGTGGFTRNQAATATFVFGPTGASASNAPNLSIYAGSATPSFIANNFYKNLSFAGSTCNPALSYNACGNLTLGGGDYTAVYPTFLASGVITSNGKIINDTTINGSGITVSLADNLTVSGGGAGLGVITLTQGTFDANNQNLSCGTFSSSNSNTRTINMGSGTWGVYLSWDTSTTTNLTLNRGTSTIQNPQFGALIFNGGGLSYYNIDQAASASFLLTINGSNSFNDIKSTYTSTGATTITFQAGTTQTVSNFTASGTAGNLLTINSSTPGSQFTLSKASGTVNAQYLAIQDSNATGGAVWNALYSTNLGNNTGWIFPGGNMFLMFM